MRVPSCRGGSVVRVHASRVQRPDRVPEAISMPCSWCQHADTRTPLSFEASSGYQHLGCCVLSMFHVRATVACDRAAPICRSIVPHPRPSRVAWQNGNAKACESSSPSQWGIKAVSVAVARGGVKCYTDTSVVGLYKDQGPPPIIPYSQPQILKYILLPGVYLGNPILLRFRHAPAICTDTGSREPIAVRPESEP